MDSRAVRCHTQGQCAPNAMEYMDFLSGIHSCGDIDDGIGVQLGSLRGVFVVAWADFENAYLTIKARRESPSSHQSPAQEQAK